LRFTDIQISAIPALSVCNEQRWTAERRI
jgi:hypothetical protein